MSWFEVFLLPHSTEKSNKILQAIPAQHLEDLTIIDSFEITQKVLQEVLPTFRKLKTLNLELSMINYKIAAEILFTLTYLQKLKLNHPYITQEEVEELQRRWPHVEITTSPGIPCVLELLGRGICQELSQISLDN